MITAGFLYLIYGLLWVALLPVRALSDVSLDNAFSASVVTGMGYASRLNHFLPIGAILYVVGIVLTFEGGLVTYKLAMWVVKRIRG